MIERTRFRLRSHRTLGLAVLLSMAFPVTALAVDGVLEINETCAALTGCFAGDAAGYPVEITSRGSYRLTSDLVVPSVFTNGIEVSDNDVSIDLNGFSIVGAACVGAIANCTPANGTGDGVQANAGALRTSVRDGSVAGMGNHGVALGEASEIRNVRASWNRFHGIFADRSNLVGNVLFQNGENGIEILTGGSLVTGNISRENGTDGIDAGVSSTVTGNTVNSNGTHGIDGSGDCVISRNTAKSNGGDGINTGTGSTVVENTANSNTGDGIDAGVDSAVHGNTVFNNSGFGLELGLTASYHRNTINGNTGGTANSGVANGRNVCDGALGCP